MQTSQPWNKVFPLSENVNHRKVEFKNRYGITLIGDLYTPQKSKLSNGSRCEIKTPVADNLFAGDTHRGISRDAFFSACKTEFLGGGGFDADVIDRASDTFGESLLHSRNMRIDFRAFGADGDVCIAEYVPLLLKQPCHLFEQSFAVNALISRVAVGKVVADVAEIGCAEHSVAESVDCHVGIAMSQ